MPREDAIRIREFNGSSFDESNTHASTIGEYRELKGLGTNVTISVNTVNQPDTFQLEQTEPLMVIAAVESNKTGGNNAINLKAIK